MTYEAKNHDPKNPNPWQALALDNSTFFQQSPKEALLRNNATISRRVVLPIVRPFARLAIAFFKLIRIVLPNQFTSSKALHGLICWGMRNFVSRDANYLILRHFHIGSQVLKFLNSNLADGQLRSTPLQPKSIEDLYPFAFVQHDLNIYNFIIELNSYLREKNREIKPVPLDKIDFSAIQDFDGELQNLPNRWHNFLDLQSAIELYTPLFGLFLSDNDFWRSSNSLQLDETVAAYVAKLFRRDFIMGLVNNKHPMVPLSILAAGFRLMLHGLDAENLYGFIRYVRDNKVELAYANI